MKTKAKILFDINYKKKACGVLIGHINVANIYKGDNKDILTVQFMDNWTTIHIKPDDVEQFADLFGIPIKMAAKVISKITGKKLCACRAGIAKEWHICTYKSDIYNDNNSLCTCCKTCEQSCEYDI